MYPQLPASPLNLIPLRCLISFTDLNYPNCYLWFSFQIFCPLLFSFSVSSIALQQVVQIKNVNSFWLFFTHRIPSGSILCCFSIKTYTESVTAAAAKSLQSCPTLCDPIDGLLGSPVPGILQARTLEWVAISFSSAWKWKVKVKLLSRVWLITTPWTAAYQVPPSMGFSRQEYWSYLLILLYLFLCPFLLTLSSSFTTSYPQSIFCLKSD